MDGSPDRARPTFVLVVCTETYDRRARGEERPGRGRGVRWESFLAYQHIYQADARNERFLPVLFEPGDVEHIPTPLQGATYYLLDSEEGYERLYRRITGQPEVVPPYWRRAASASDDRTLKVWDLETGQELASIALEGALASPSARTARPWWPGMERGTCIGLRYVGGREPLRGRGDEGTGGGLSEIIFLSGPVIQKDSQ